MLRDHRLDTFGLSNMNRISQIRIIRLVTNTKSTKRHVKSSHSMRYYIQLAYHTHKTRVSLYHGSYGSYNALVTHLKCRRKSTNSTNWPCSCFDHPARNPAHWAWILHDQPKLAPRSKRRRTGYFASSSPLPFCCFFFFFIKHRFAFELLGEIIWHRQSDWNY